MKYGNELTTKLEEVVNSRNINSKEWETFKNQVVHSYNTAESIGNRTVNPQDHLEWEERLVRLGIIERKRENVKQKFIEKLKQSVYVDAESPKADKSKVRVLTPLEMQREAEQRYINTGMLPSGYTLTKEVKTVKIQEEACMKTNPIDRLSATRNNNKESRKESIDRLSASRNNSTKNNKKKYENPLER